MFNKAPYISEGSCIVGKKEGEGPMKKTFDLIEHDPFFGGKTWEEGESNMQRKTVELLISKSFLKKDEIRYIFAGDLLGQLMATTFGLKSLKIPIFGVYGACSTMGEAMSLAAITVSGGCADNVIALASSHFAGAEKTFRYPLDYGSQRPFASTWTVTGCGATVITSKGGFAKIIGITTGRIMDYGVKDPMNMGAVMAPGAFDTIYRNFVDFGIEPDYYDKIITGDLGYVGRKILIELLNEKGYDIADRHMDCGIEMFDANTQNTNSGGSGCGCSASLLCGYIYNKLKSKEWNRILFVPTGALMSTVSFNEGNSIPCVAHGVMIESV